jgi:gluconate 5-dehydrogenase
MSGVDVRGRRVVITGAGRGLGQLLATAFDAAGAELGLVARSEPALKEVAASLSREALVCPGDVRAEGFNESVAQAMVDRFGGVDVWICNAGVSPAVSTIEEHDPAVWRDIIDVNLTGTFLGARAAASVMTAGGRIIVTGSVLGQRPRAGLGAYSVSKNAVEALVKVLALEVGSRAITANAVALGWFETGMGTFWHRNAKRSDDIAEHTALGRWGAPDDLAGVYLFLASDASAYVTGTTVTVDGGYSLR